MTFEAWAGKYRGIIVDVEVARDAIADFKAVFVERKPILYGAGKLGRQIQELLRQIGVEVHAFVDRNAVSIKTVSGVEVWEPRALRAIADADRYVLFASVNKLTVESIAADLATLATGFTLLHIGFDTRVTVQSALCVLQHRRGEALALKECYECSILDNTCPILARYLQDISGFNAAEAKGTPSLKMIGYVLGSVCTLNCLHCCESIAQIPRAARSFVPTQVVIDDISKLARACEFVTLLEFVGGEPFLHPGFVEILQASLRIRNIGVIHVFTNGTVTPSPELCEVLAGPRVVMYVSNYVKSISEKHREKVVRTETVLNDIKASYVWGADISWYDISSFEDVGGDETTLRARYASCFLHTCNRLHMGSLYRCPHHYSGIALGKLTPRDDLVRIHDFSDDELPAVLDRFVTLGYADACRYCRMPFNAPFVPLGIQAP